MRKFLRILWTTHSIECVAHSIECAPFYRMAGILGIPRMRNAFYRMRKFLECAEHIHVIPSSLLLEADGCCISLMACVNSSKQRERATINILQLSMVYYKYIKITIILCKLLTKKMRRDFCLAGFFQDLNKSVELSVVTVHCSLKVTDSIPLSDGP